MGSRRLLRVELAQGRDKWDTDESIRHRRKSRSQNLELGGTWELMGQQPVHWCGQNTAEARGVEKEIRPERQGHPHLG